MNRLKSIETKIAQGHRISAVEARALFEEASMTDLRRLATQVKTRFHPEKEATYLIMAIINYTNICVAMCDYCSFYRLPHQEGTYLLTYPEIKKKIEDFIELGGAIVGLNGGFHPKLRIADYAKIFANIRKDFGDQIEFYGMTVAEFMFAAKRSQLSYRDAARDLKNQGSKWITGGGAEILVDSFRQRHSPGKFSAGDYYAAQQAILAEGLGSTATMVIGFDESLDERFEHLETLRNFQDQMGQNYDQGLVSFLCWTYKPYHNELGGEEISTEEYLRWLAISRIFLDNFKHIRTSVLTKNEEALLGLEYGADDFDLPTEDEVTQKAGATITHEFEQVLQYGRDLGFTLKKREPFRLENDSWKITSHALAEATLT